MVRGDLIFRRLTGGGFFFRHLCEWGWFFFSENFKELFPLETRVIFSRNFLPRWKSNGASLKQNKTKNNTLVNIKQRIIRKIAGWQYLHVHMNVWVLDINNNNVQTTLSIVNKDMDIYKILQFCIFLHFCTVGIKILYCIVLYYIPRVYKVLCGFTALVFVFCLFVLCCVCFLTRNH